MLLGHQFLNTMKLILAIAQPLEIEYGVPSVMGKSTKIAANLHASNYLH